MKLFKNSYKYEKPKSEPKSKMLSSIIETSTQKVIPSVDEYIQAVNAAKSKLLQSRNLLYDHYNTVLDIDNIVNSLLNKRYTNIRGKKIGVKYNNRVLKNSIFYDSPMFTKFMVDIFKTKLWGFNVFEFHNKDGFSYKVLPHKHINPYRKEVLKRQYDPTGIPFDKKNDIMFSGSADDLGLLAQITLLSIYRRYGMFNYSRYAELAAENFTQLKTKGYTSDANMDKIQSALSNRASGLLEVPEGVELESESQTSSQQNQLFEGYIRNLKEELAILILGQTMTTFDGSSRSQAEVHSDEQKDIFYEDDVFVLNELNHNFKKYIKFWDSSMNPDKLEFFYTPDTDRELRVKLDEYKKLKDLGVTFTDDELRDTFKNIL